MEKTINLGSNRLLPAENHPKSTAQKLRRRLEIQFEWKNISSAYFVNLSNSEDAWLELILKLLLELDHSKDTKENIKERQDIFRRLSILCGRPQFVFGSFHKKKGIGKKYKSFRKRMGKLCDDFDEYIAINNVFNCYKKADEYLKRDSMPPLNALVDENSISTIQTKIIECFQKYRGEIATLFPKKGKKSEDENKNNSDYTPDMRFLKTVITNPKLITMAGTLFVRDMQYFMMRKSNHYKKYLSPSGMDFKLTRTYPRWVQRQEAFATRKCAKKIREILQEVIQKRTPNINMELSQSIEETIFRKDLSSEEKNSISRLYVWYQIFGTLSRDIVEGKNVPYPGIGCKTTTLAYMTALEFNLNHDQTEWLVQYMPNIIWGKNSVEKIFQKTTKTEFQNSEQIIATVYKGNIIKNLIMDCQSYTKYRPNETTGGIFVSWRRKEELPTGA